MSIEKKLIDRTSQIEEFQKVFSSFEKKSLFETILSDLTHGKRSIELPKNGVSSHAISKKLRFIDASSIQEILDMAAKYPVATHKAADSIQEETICKLLHQIAIGHTVFELIFPDNVRTALAPESIITKLQSDTIKLLNSKGEQAKYSAIEMISDEELLQIVNAAKVALHLEDGKPKQKQPEETAKEAPLAKSALENKEDQEKSLAPKTTPEVAPEKSVAQEMHQENSDKALKKAQEPEKKDKEAEEKKSEELEKIKEEQIDTEENKKEVVQEAPEKELQIDKEHTEEAATPDKEKEGEVD